MEKNCKVLQVIYAKSNWKLQKDGNEDIFCKDESISEIHIVLLNFQYKKGEG